MQHPKSQTDTSQFVWDGFWGEEKLDFFEKRTRGSNSPMLELYSSPEGEEPVEMENAIKETNRDVVGIIVLSVLASTLVRHREIRREGINGGPRECASIMCPAETGYPST